MEYRQFAWPKQVLLQIKDKATKQPIDHKKEHGILQHQSILLEKWEQAECRDIVDPLDYRDGFLVHGKKQESRRNHGHQNRLLVNLEQKQKEPPGSGTEAIDNKGWRNIGALDHLEEREDAWRQGGGQSESQRELLELVIGEDIVVLDNQVGRAPEVSHFVLEKPSLEWKHSDENLIDHGERLERRRRSQIKWTQSNENSQHHGRSNKKKFAEVECCKRSEKRLFGGEEFGQNVEENERAVVESHLLEENR